MIQWEEKDENIIENHNLKQRYDYMYIWIDFKLCQCFCVLTNLISFFSFFSMAIIRLISMNHEKDYSEDDDLEYKQLQSPSSSRYVRSLTVFFKD